MGISKNLTPEAFTDRLFEFTLSCLSDQQKDGFGFFPNCDSSTLPTLGSTCFGLKILKTIGMWDRLDNSLQNDLVQKVGGSQRDKMGSLKWRNLIYDTSLIGFLGRRDRMRYKVKRAIFGFHTPEFYAEKTILAESKQCFATLNDLEPNLFEKTELKKVHLHPDFSPLDYVKNQDWRHPWAAGGQSSGLCALLNFSDQNHDTDKDQIRGHFKTMADPKTGCYFEGEIPNYGNLINGSMKVINALSWLEEPIHYPEQLIDVVLSRKPQSEGCHIVDAIFVLYQCLKYSNYRCDDICRYLKEVCKLIEFHYREDGGFSYYPDRCQKVYYGYPLGKRPLTGDIHGSVLFVWALSMIDAVTGHLKLDWKVFKA